MVGVSIMPVSGALGAEVCGLDLEHLTDEGFAALERALIDHLVVFLPDQHLTPDGHRTLSRRFGEIEIHPFLQKLSDEYQEIVVLHGDQGARADVWHTDVTFSESPPLCSTSCSRSPSNRSSNVATGGHRAGSGSGTTAAHSISR